MQWKRGRDQRSPQGKARQCLEAVTGARAGKRLDWAKAVAEKPVVATTGTFHLEWREVDKRVRSAVGEHPRQAKAALAAQAKVVELRAIGMK